MNNKNQLLDDDAKICAAMKAKIRESERFNPKEVRVETKNTQMLALISRIEHKEIELNPSFQRSPDVWDAEKQSMLIESMMLNIPIPAFYMDATDDDKWIVIDGLQRLNTVQNFVIKKILKLKCLNIMKEYEDCKFDDLPSEMQRRIQETDVVIYQIKKGTPEAVRYEIFNRINTGGTPLSPQEIRHALHPGPFLLFLEKLAGSQEFLTATRGSISSRRMGDRECVLRFMAFSFMPPKDYIKNDFNLFLHKAMDVGNRLSLQKMAEYEARFYRAMDVAYRIFQDRAFRKYYINMQNRPPISKSLFESISINIDSLTHEQQEILVQRRREVNARMEMLFEKDKDFEAAILQGSASGAKRIRYRFAVIKRMFEDILSGY